MVSLLSGHGLAYDYPGPLRAVDGVDLELCAHELLVVCGPNGSGKSTLLKLLGGSLEPLAGEVRVHGRPLTELDAGQRARCVAQVPQSLRSLPDVTVEHFVLAGRYAYIDRWAGPRVQDRDAVRQALADADIAELGQRPMASLSGGQRQRVLIARALAQATEVLLVDEPTAALDPEHQLHVFALLGRLVEQGRGAVVVTHDLNLASQFATAIALLRDGRVITRGTPADVLRPEVLAPVYGEHLHYARLPDGSPIVVPWMAGRVS